MEIATLDETTNKPSVYLPPHYLQRGKNFRSLFTRVDQLRLLTGCTGYRYVIFIKNTGYRYFG